MNRLWLVVDTSNKGVPHRRGDEPVDHSSILLRNCVPHRRGDEPAIPAGLADGERVFPTGVGMNRVQIMTVPDLGSVPHRRGDEPAATAVIIMLTRCSPQAWG